MRNKFYFILSLLLCFSLFSTSIFSIDIFVEGNKLSLDVPPQIIKGRTIAPLGAIGRSLEAEIQWNEKSKIVTVTKDTNILTLQIGNPIARINKAKIRLDLPPQIINSRTMVPVSFIAKAFEKTIEWDEATKTVYIGKRNPVAPGKFLVTRVIDGDTIEINYSGKLEKVRLIGIDTPESVHPDSARNVEFGEIASKFTKDALENKEISLEFDVSQRDYYGRLLAYVWIDGTMFNKTLLESGMAQVSTYPPDVKYSKDFLLLQEEARKNKIGLWLDQVYPEKNEELIKGNKNSMIYHLPTGRDYDKISAHNIIWFENEDAAKKAGFRKSQQ